MSDSWPPRWEPGKTYFKGGTVALKQERKSDKREVVTDEDKAKAEVRKQDPACRFPNCVCRALRLHLDVAHRKSKGMGGDKGLRSTPDQLIRLCVQRHQSGRISLHRVSLRIEPLTEKGTRGPCEFWVDVNAIEVGLAARKKAKWFLVGTERSRGVFEPFTPEQLAVLKRIEKAAA